MRCKPYRVVMRGVCRIWCVVRIRGGTAVLCIWHVPEHVRWSLIVAMYRARNVTFFF